MNLRKTLTISSIFLFLSLSCTGCIDLFDNVTTTTIIYEEHPTKISYHITYGYQVNLTGTGSATIHYQEDLPELLKGTIANLTIHTPLHGKQETYLGNEMIFWNETFENDQDIFFGISADVSSESMMISNLDDTQAMSIDELQLIHPTLIDQYCNPQGNTTHLFIDPKNPDIRQIATTIQSTSNTTNTLLIAKDLFTWLKTNTNYVAHLSNQYIQPASETCQIKTGDCDDLSFLYISLCRAVSIPARFIRGYLIDDQGTRQQVIPHVWVEIYAGNNIGNNGWVPVECAGVGQIQAELHQNFGIEDAFHLRLYTDDGSNASMNIYTTHISVEYQQGLHIDITHQSLVTNYTIINSNKLQIIDDSIRKYQ